MADGVAEATHCGWCWSVVSFGCRLCQILGTFWGLTGPEGGRYMGEWTVRCGQRGSTAAVWKCSLVTAIR